MNRPCSWLIVALLTLTSLSAPVAGAEPTSTDTPLVGEKIRQLMQDRNYAEAVKAIDEAAAAKDAPKDYLAYLKGRTLYLNKEYDQAIGVFDQL